LEGLRTAKVSIFAMFIAGLPFEGQSRRLVRFGRMSEEQDRSAPAAAHARTASSCNGGTTDVLSVLALLLLEGAEHGDDKIRTAKRNLLHDGVAGTLVSAPCIVLGGRIGSPAGVHRRASSRTAAARTGSLIPADRPSGRGASPAAAST
jgi:hypothetical protein